MSIVISTELICDDCERMPHGPTGIPIGTVNSTPRRREVRKEAREEGWARKRDDGMLKDLCPTCQKEIRKLSEQGE